MSDYELKRINALTEASAINDSDVFAIDSAAGTKKVAWETLKGEVDADISEAVSNKADKDGTYPDMAVGSVLGTNTVTDKEPYFLRPSASIGDREFDTLVGGTLGWNQLVSLDNINSETISGVTFTVNSDGTVVANGTATALIRKSVIFIGFGTHKDVGHKILYWGCPSGGSANGYRLTVAYIGDTTQDTGNGAVWSIPDTAYSGALGICIDSGTVCNNVVFKPQCIDLTTLFGSTIADYIYSLEQATAGAGVAWVRKYLPNTYYAYCAPTLKHVSGVSAHVMRDANNNVIGNYAIDSTWVGMGIPKLDSANKLYFDGDTYASDGTVTERYGIVDLGTLNWQYWNGIFYADIVGKAYTNSDSDIICASYASYPFNLGNASSALSVMSDKQIAGFLRASGTATDSFVYVKDSAYTDAAAFKTAMSGVYLVYEKATSTTSTASPFTSPQICDKDGTEEYITSGLVPVGHETEYVENLADKLTDIPNLPTTAGNYHLAVTVDGGVPSYSWVSA